MQKCAGIVTYNPNISLLLEDINSVSELVKEIFIYDNGSDNQEDIVKICNLKGNLKVILDSENVGIATALNRLSEIAIDKGYDWILTLDQDSIVTGSLLEKYEEVIEEDSKIGIVTCLVRDKASNNIVGPQFEEYEEILEVENCITSGSFMNLEAWRSVGGFDDKMFIEWVDYDICASMRECGWKIICINEIGLLQEFAKPVMKKLFYKKEPIYTYPYSPLRKYYQVRNELYFMRKHGEPVKIHIKNIFVRWARTVLQEDEKMKKSIYILKGCIAGMTMQLN